VAEHEPTLRRVRFQGGREATGPLTLGQRNVLSWVRNETDPFSAVMRWQFSLPHDTTLADVEQALAVLLSRHEALRSTYRIDQDKPSQQVIGSGELAIEVHELLDTEADDVVAERLIDRLRGLGIDFTAGLPLRIAVATRSGRPVVAVGVDSHLAVDFASIAMIGQQFSELIADPAGRQVGKPCHQPLDQAELECSRHGRRQADSALKYWETHLRAAPQCLYPVPLPDELEPGYVSGFLYSSAAGQALGHILARTGVSRPAILLAALSAVLSLRTGTRRCTFVSVSGNRFRLRLRDYIGTLAQDGLVALAVDTEGFDELAVRAKRATLGSNANSMFDAAALWQLIDDVGAERGVAFSRDFTINDVSAHLDIDTELSLDDPAKLAGVLDQSTVEFAESPPFPVVLMCNPFRLTPELHLALTGDTSRVSRAEIEGLLRGVERLLVAAATGDVSLSRLAEITGLQPVARNADWVFIDECWVKLSEARRLLSEAAGGDCYVAVSDDGALTGYVGGGTNVERLHADCMTLLRQPGWQLAMAPAHYVLCDGAPAEVFDAAGWQARPVVAEGPGRPRSDPEPAG
jgi:hypothetical protein